MIIPNVSAIPTTSSVGSFSLTSPPSGVQTKTVNWAVTATDRAKYDQLFDSLNPVNGKLPGAKVCFLCLNVM